MLKQGKATYSHGKIVNIYIVYEISKNYNIIQHYKIVCLELLVRLNLLILISTNIIGFDRKGEFSFDNGFGLNCIGFGVGMSSSVHVDNKKKDILILGKGPTQGLYGTTLTAEKLYSINCTEHNKKFCLNLHYNLANSCLFVNGTEIYKFKAKDLRL